MRFARLSMLTAVQVAQLSLLIFFSAFASRDDTLTSAASPFRQLKRCFRKKEYTPLVFFKVPRDTKEEVDEMERIVSEIEDELDVRVERLDLARNKPALAVMSLLTTKSTPFLYHRESLQTISVDTNRAKRNRDREEIAVDKPLIDKEQVRAWAKGRFLPPPNARWGEIKTERPTLVEKSDENALDQADLELLKEESLTPLQLEGKRSMEARTSKRAEAAAAAAAKSDR